MITKIKNIISGICVICGFSACVDTVILPDNKTVDEDYWQKKSEVETVVSAAYAQLRDATAIRNMIIWGATRSTLRRRMRLQRGIRSTQPLITVTSYCRRLRV